MDLFGREQLRFRYAAVALARFEGQEYVEKGSPVAAALAALMSRRGAREPLKLRLLMMERVALSGLDDARKFLLLNLIETYFKLASDERQEFEGLLSRERYRECPASTILPSRVASPQNVTRLPHLVRTARSKTTA